jgi:hypothetical protein
MVRRIVGCVAVAAVALLTIGSSTAMAASEVQPPDELLALKVPAKHGFRVEMAIYPDRGVAVLWTQRGDPESRRRRWLGVAYAVATPRRSSPTGVDVRFGHLGRLRGHFVPGEPARRGRRSPGCRGPRPVSEEGRFVGRFRFRGAGGYLAVNAAHAGAYRDRSFRLRCAHGHAEHFGGSAHLFEYIQSPTREFAGSDGTFLEATTSTRHRVTEFMAVRHLFVGGTSFRAGTLEWLPGGVATMRWVEAPGANSLFRTDPPTLHPAAAMVEPPAPFSGHAEYSRSAHSLRGPLSVKFLGLRLRIAGRSARAGVCVLTRSMRRRVCS